MNYPVWYLPEIGGGLLVALIAVTHVFVSHFAVGGGLYLVLTERKGLREKNPEILEFTRRHTKFFLLLTMVFGGITGVGIWFIISLVQPAATSLLIHTFVYGWAAEWVWFLVEIIALLIYFYTFGRMDDRTHQMIGWIYFLAAWLSLFLINGIIDFMLTPGAWVEEPGFWTGFFNPSFWPSLAFRSFFAFMLAGLYAFVTCAFLRDSELKRTMTRYSGKWALISLLLSLPAGLWYLTVLPEPAKMLIKGASPTIRSAWSYGLYGGLITFVLILLLGIVRPALNNRALAILGLIPAFLLLGAFEWTREAARRPYVLNQVMYSNGITLSEAAELNGNSFLAQNKWTMASAEEDQHLARAGAELFKFQCYACHTIGGMNNDIVPKTAGMDFAGLYSYLQNVMHKRPYMPPFLGDQREAAALSAYLVGDLHGKEVDLAQLEATSDVGEKLYRENCTGCHGLEIARQWAAALTVEQVIAGLESLSSLNDMMPDFTGTPEEKQQLAAYLRSGEEGSPPGQEGAAILQQNCIGCHGEDIILAWSQGKPRAELDQGLAELEVLNPMMAGLELGDEERDSLAAWLLSQGEGGVQ